MQYHYFNYCFIQKHSDLEEKNDKILQNLFQSFYSEENDDPLKINDFIREYRGWKGRLKIPNYQCDVIEFGKYLLDSLSEDFSDLFFNDIKSDEEMLYEIEDQQIRNYFVQLPIINVSIQKMIDDKLQFCPNITVFPTCLFLSLLRQDTDKFNKQCISVNSFIHILNENYKFVGAVLLHVHKDESIVSHNKKVYKLMQKRLEEEQKKKLNTTKRKRKSKLVILNY